MQFLRSLGVWIVISVATVLFGLPAIPLALVPPRGEWFLKLARGWARLILAVSGVSVGVRHAERLEAGASFVIAPNHESFYDILVLLAVLPVSVRFLAKRNLFRLPILGWSMTAAGFIPVDRETRSRSFALVDAALSRLRGGRSLIVFPEETRTRTGELRRSRAARRCWRSGPSCRCCPSESPEPSQSSGAEGSRSSPRASASRSAIRSRPPAAEPGTAPN